MSDELGKGAEAEPFGSPERVRRVWGVVRVALRGLYRSQLPRMAAALSYRTIFSLVPVIVVGVAVTGAFVKGERLDVFAERVFEYIGISTIEVGVGASEQDAVSSQLEDLLTQIVERVQSVSFEAIGILGVLFLIYAAISMLMELERAFNTICHAPRGRSWGRRITTYWTTLTLGAVFLIATFYISDVAADWLVGLGRVEGAESGWVSQSLVEAAINIALTAALLWLAYTTVPNAQVGLRPAVAGALVASIVWALGKWGFTGYVKNAAGLEKLYGAIALLPLFLMWIYLTWLIVLFGLQIAYMLQSFSEWKDGIFGDENDEERFIDPVSGVDLVAVVARRFAAGKKTFVQDLAQEVGVDDRAAAVLVERLVDAEILTRTESGESRGVGLARPADSIHAGEVARACEDLFAGRQHARCDEARRAVRDARQSVLADRTVADLVNTQAGTA